jgi:hypothetical protein
MLYHKSLNKLIFDVEVLSSILAYAKHEQTPWKRAFDRNGIRWNVEELPLSIDQFPILKEIADGLQNEFQRPSFFLSKVLPGGLINHIDHRKWCNLAFPLQGDFDQTPTLFLDQFSHVLETCHFKKHALGHYIPVILNTRATHAVYIPEESRAERIVLMMNLFDWPDHLFDKVDQDTIWCDTTHFNYSKI